LSGPERAKVAHILTAAGDRIKAAGDVTNYTEFFVPDDQLPYDDRAFDKHLRRPGAADLLREYRERLGAAEPFDAPTLERVTHDFVTAKGIKIGEIIHAIRVSVTGKTIGLGLFDCLVILGRASSLARIDRALEKL
jgi:glutamyl-tRNA synthetase